MKIKHIKGLMITEAQSRAIKNFTHALKTGDSFVLSDKEKTLDVLEELLTCYKEAEKRE